MVIKHFRKGDTVYPEFQTPNLFFILHTGILAVEKQVEVTYANMWPVASKKWGQLQRTQYVTKVLQHITPGMYFGES